MTEDDIRRWIRPDFDELDEYKPVQPLDVLAAEIGIAEADLVKLDANENLYGPIPEVLEAIGKADLHIYPDPGQHALRSAIAHYARVDPDQVVAGAGADDLIDVLIRLVEPEAVVNATPTFGMYEFLSRVNGARVISVPRLQDFSPDIQAIGDAVADGASLIFLASPNNPTGNLLTPEEIEALAALDVLVVIDEAYFEFAGQSAVPMIQRFPNVVVLRTFSKWAALAGLRVGYSLSHPEIARRMMAIKQPYNVSVAADVAARVSLEHRGVILESVRCITAERERMTAQLGKLEWLRPLPSTANFVLVKVLGRPAREVAAELRRRGVLIRYYDSPELRDYIRISAGRPQDTDRLLCALHELEAA